jgi:hypothetical protein
MPAAYGGDHLDFMRVDHAQLAEDCRVLEHEKAAAPNGGRNEHYQLFGSTFPTGSREERALKDLAFFGECYLNALLPPWYYRLSAAAKLVALLKAECAAVGETPQVRSVAVGGIKRRLFCATVVKQTAPDFATWLGPHQVAVGVSASAEKLTFDIKAVPEDRPDFAVWKLDFKNAFNEFSRALLTQRFAEAPLQMRRLLPFVCAHLGPSAPLATSASWADFASVEGTQQTAGLPARACMWFKPHFDWLLDALREKGGTGAEVVGAIMDDAAAIAPPHAITAVQAELERRLHLDGSTLQLRKCQWHANSACTRALFPDNAKVCTARKDPDPHGIDIDGVPMGSAAFKVARHEETLEAAAAVIAGIDKALISHGTGHIHRQAAFAMLRVCVYTYEYATCCGVHAPQMSTATPNASTRCS